MSRFSKGSRSSLIGSRSSIIEDPNSAGWRELKTESGIPYYHNQLTGELSAFRPRALLSIKEVEEEGTGQWVWIPDKDHGYLAAMVLEETKDKEHYEVRTQEQKIKSTVNKSDAIKVSYATLTQTEDDLVHCEDMSEPFVLHNLRQRLKEKQIYTSIGDVLVVMNPYTTLPLYGRDQIEDYTNSSISADPMRPHIFKTADTALYNLLYSEARQNQSIIISGESGAGKTETTKHVLHFLSEVAGGQENTNIEERIIQANPVLEAFGNAKTIRNDNSSRFGKYCEVFFNRKKQICGCRNVNYLLEKSRVVSQAQDERNFHIFYQLIRGAIPTQKAEYFLTDIEDFQYLNQSGCDTIPNASDKEGFEEILEGLQALEIDDEETNQLFRITTAVLHLGNINFEPSISGDFDSPAQVVNESKSQNAIIAASKLLKLEEGALKRKLVMRTLSIKGRRSVSTITLNTAKANESRDATAKFIYTKLFDWLIWRVNVAFMGQSGQVTKQSIGILDIFGFEIFEKNSLEQLCINLANEKLQQQFNKNTFALEEKVYRTEEIGYVDVGYKDNQPVLDLIEGRGKGILPMLDEELRLNKTNDATFLAKMINTCKNNPIFSTDRQERTHFFISHYAGSVVYESIGFYEKNKDRISPDLQQLVSASQDSFLKGIFDEKKTNSKSSSKKSKRKSKMNTVSEKFRSQLKDLMKTLNSTVPQYVRCIKSNSMKKPLACEAHLTLEQLKYSGVFEVIAIRKRGYPYRLPHGQFARRYACVDKEDAIDYSDDIKACESLSKLMRQDNKVIIGKTLCLYKFDTHRTLELHRALSVENTVLTIQTWWRMAYRLKFYRKVCRVKKELVQRVEEIDINTEDNMGLRNQVNNLENIIREGEEIKIWLWQIPEQLQRTQEALQPVQEAYTIQQDLKKILNGHKTPENCYDDVKRLLRAANRMGYKTPIIARAKEKIRPVQERKDCAEALTRAIRDANEELIRKALGEADRLHLRNVKLISSAKRILDVIQKEKDVLHELENGFKKGGWLTPGDKIAWDHLEKTLKKAEKFGMKTKKGKFLERLNTKLVDLRQVMRPAVDTEDEKLWDRVALVLSGMQRQDTVANEAEEDEEQLGELYRSNEERLRLCEYSPEVKAAQSELQRIRDGIACKINLREGIDEISQAKLEKGLDLARKLGMDEEGKEISQAARLLSAIKACRSIATSAIEEIKCATRGFGITQKIQKNLEKVIEEEQKHDEAKNIPEVIQCIDYLETVKKENKISSGIKQGCKEGAWTNEGIESGDYPHYQGKNTIDVNSLREILRDTRDMNPLTHECRSWRALGILVLNLREKLYEAVGIQDGHMWRTIEKVVADLTNEERNNDPTIGRLPRHPTHQEIEAARKEASYVKSVLKVLKVVSTATKEKNELKLIEACRAAEDLNCLPEFNSELREAKDLLNLITACKRKMEEAIKRVDSKLLAASIQQAESFQYETTEVKKCREYRTVCLDLEEGISLFSESRLTQNLVKAEELGCNQDSLIISRANQLLERISECQKKSKQAIDETIEARTGEGTTHIQYKALQEALAKAEALGGLIDQPEIKKVREILDELNQEEKMELELSNALSKGAWLNHNVELGDFDNYQTKDTIDLTLGQVISKCENLDPQSVALRKSKRLAGIICKLREKMAEAVGTQNVEKWQDVENVLNSPDVNEFTRSQYPNAELIAAQREVRFELKLYKMTTTLEDGLSKHSSETLCDGQIQAQLLNLHNLPLVLEAKAESEKILRCRRKARYLMENIKYAQENSGISSQENDQLRYIVTAADALGGLRHYEEVKNCVDWSIRLENEMKLVLNLEKSMQSELGWLNEGKTHGDYDNYQSKDTINWQELDTALQACKDSTMSTLEGRARYAEGKFLRDLREKLTHSVQTQDSQAWQGVEEILNHTKTPVDALTSESINIYSRFGQILLLFFVQNPEIIAAKEELAYQKKVQVITKRLESAIHTPNRTTLSILLSSAEELGMQPKYNDTVKDGRATLDRIEKSIRKMNFAIKTVEEKQLIEACDDAKSFNYKSSLQSECEELKDEVIKLNNDLVNAKEKIEKDSLEDVVSRADVISLRGEDYNRCKELIHYMNHDQMKFHNLQLEAAKKLNEEKRQQSIQKKIRNLHVQGSGNKYAWPYAKILTPSDDWARAQGMSMNKAKVAAGMHSYTEKVISSSLTPLEQKGTVDPQNKRFAVQCFSDMLDLSKDKGTEVVISNLIDGAMKDPMFTNEVYCQILKQLTGNPYPDSRALLWKLLWAILHCIAPVGMEMQCVVEKFLRNSYADDSYVQAMYVYVFENKKPDHPGEPGITKLLADCIVPEDSSFNQTEVYQRGARLLPTCCCCFG